MKNPELSRYIRLSRTLERLQQNLLTLETLVGEPLRIFPRRKLNCPIERHAPERDALGRVYHFRTTYRFSTNRIMFAKFCSYEIQDMNDAYLYSQLSAEDKKIVIRNVFKWLLQRSGKLHYKVLNWFL